MRKSIVYIIEVDKFLNLDSKSPKKFCEEDALLLGDIDSGTEWYTAYNPGGTIWIFTEST